jgi:hypothetical protein
MQEEVLHLPSWAKTALGTSIGLYRKGHSQSERPVIFIGGVHGDEPEGIRLAEDLLYWIEGAIKLKKNLRNWILIPCLNPDGAKKHDRCNSRGVDLNRNFPSKDWSPEAKSARYSPGEAPGSELEVQALCELIKNENPLLIVHFHSWEPCVVYSGEPGRVWAEQIAQAAGYEAKPDIGYPTPGSLGQFGWMDHQIPVICVEAKEGDVLDELWPRFGRGLAAMVVASK